MASTKSYINIGNKYDRVVVLVDMDCFYCQVEEKLDPSLKGKPIAVVQYNAWRGGGIIAVNYPAKEQGVTRHMRGDEAKEQCPDIVLVKVPSVREKADLTKYREAGKEVAVVLQKFTPLLERASVDEAYLDITEEVVKRFEAMDRGEFRLQPSDLSNTFAVNYDHIGEFIQETSGRIGTDVNDFHCSEEDLTSVKKSDIKLLIGAGIANDIRALVKEKTGYDCSAGIAHNKILAKLACGINKPNKQTILPLRQVESMFSTLPVGKIKGLGGKFGEDLCEMLKIKYMGDLLKFTEADLQKRFDEKNGTWLYLVAQGIDLECVMPRFYSKSIGCCKKFPGRNAITGIPTLEHWLGELANEICERMEKDIIENSRKAKQMVVSYIQEINGQDVSSSRSIPIPGYVPEAMAKCAYEVLRKNTDVFIKPGTDKFLNNALKFLGLSVGKFETIETNQNTIQKLFLNHSKKRDTESPAIEPSVAQTEVIPQQKPEKKSFFAKYLKKVASRDADIASNLENASSTKFEPENASTTKPEPETATTTESEPKSFFLNAIKRKNAEISPTSDAEQHLTDLPKPSTSNPNEPVESQAVAAILEEPSTSSASNYTSTYAEYRAPEPKPNDFITCEKCGRKISAYDLETHNDFHFAFELSQVQREEFRSEMKAKTVTTPPNKKPKLSASQSSHSKKSASTALTCSNEISIDKFLLKEPPTSCASDADLQKCPECYVSIPIDKMSEHMDYHAARKIQTDWNKEVIRKEGQSGGEIAVTFKRSSTKSGGSSKVSAVKMKSIKTFFVDQI